MTTTRPIPSGTSESAGRALRRRGPAFTMIEALVAIGAMALVTVGIAAIFQSVGKTVSGGRRLSVLNTYAAMIEGQMRRDFERMTRDGFLVIRNQYADTAPAGKPDGKFSAADDLVSVSPTDPAPRPRRIDEIMFIAKGDYASVREPLDPAYVARAEFARIYFGHGLRLPASAPNNSYARPETDASTVRAPKFGRKDAGGGTGVNQYAKDWTLLRHATLLARPRTTEQTLPQQTVFGWRPLSPAGSTILSDKPGQIGLQPAASSIFRSVARLSPNIVPVNSFVRGRDQRTPAFSSGIIDIASCDLSDIRGTIYGMAGLNLRPSDLRQFDDYPPNNSNFAGWKFTPSQNVGPGFALDLAKQWMDDAWPTLSDQTSTAADAGTRIRYEPGPTDYITTISGSTTTAVQRAYRRADQLALASSNFIPGCTEFIVEYSFGITDPATGRLIWHGMHRQADLDGDGRITTVASDPYIVMPYPLNAANPGGPGAPLVLEYRDAAGKVHRGTQTAPVVESSFTDAVWDWDKTRVPDPGRLYISRSVEKGQTIYLTSGAPASKAYTVQTVAQDGSYVTLRQPPSQWTTGATLKRAGIAGRVYAPQAYSVPPQLIYAKATSPNDLVQTAFFGYTDPTDDDSLPSSPSKDDEVGTGRPWPWPTLVRVTLRLTDPDNPGVEESFQFVMPTAGNPS